MTINLIFRFALLNLVIITCLADYLSLDGNQWHAINQNKSITVKAKVPGSIYSDLRRGLILKEDIYKGYNDINYRWVSYDNWTYERDFNVDSSLLSKESVHLLAKGIDTISTVFVNNVKVGTTHNQFIRYKFDVKKVLKSGENKIRIEFKSSPLYAKQKFNEYKHKYGYVVPPECPYPTQNGECHYNFVRKMHAQSSWDWGPAFPTQGIWKSIGIEAYNKAIIRDMTVETTPDPKNKTQWILTVNTFVESSSDKKLDAIFNFNLEDSHQLVHNEKHSLTPGKDEFFKFVVPIKNIPILPWYPNGVSKDQQKLYKLKVNLTFANSSETSVLEKWIGFRTIELIQTPIKPKGLSFQFEVNGQKFFAKGSNWIPAHVLMEELTEEYIHNLLTSAKEANMNMLRVWGGGIYESDYFYELADKLGIMIWQDLMFACALYPTDKDFLDNVDVEVKQQIRRLQPHPSIAIWAGNNENMEKMVNGGPRYTMVKKNLTLYHKDYVELYINHIKPIVLSEDKSRPYVSSSPSNGLEDEKEKWTDKEPQDQHFGDIHYYNNNAKLWDWRSFPKPRFASEYGFQSHPSLEAYLKVLNEKELTFPVSKALDHREHAGTGITHMEHQAGIYFKLPTHGGADRLDDMIYLTQITQAMAMRTETEFYRRSRAVDPKTGLGYTMGALYWQLNDDWQAPTWSSIEFGADVNVGKWKLLHNYAKNYLDNILVSPYEDSNQTLKVSLVRDDYNGEKEFDLSVKVYKWSQNKPIHEIKQKVKTESFSAKVVFTKSIPELLKESKCADRTQCVLSFEVSDSQSMLKAKNFMLLYEPKNSKIIKPNIKLVDVRTDNKTDYFTLTLSSEAVAPFVQLDFKLNSGILGHFSDNGFFIFDNKTTVHFYPKISGVTPQRIRDNLRIKTLTDIK